MKMGVARRVAAVAAAVILTGAFVATTAYANDEALETFEAKSVVAQQSGGWQHDGSKWHFWRNGKMVTSRWIKTASGPGIKGAAAGRHTYWIDANGDLAVKRLIDPSAEIDAKAGFTAYALKYGYIAVGITRIDKTHVLLADKKGKLYQPKKKGFRKIKRFSVEKKKKSQRYYLERTKKDASVFGARVGLFHVRGKLFYAYGKTGYVMRDDYKKIKNSYYYAGKKTGKMKRDRVVTRLYRKAQGYSSPSRYLIMVDVDNPRVMVLQGSRGHWKKKFIWKCCTGAPSTPTVTGVFAIGAKGYDFGEGHGYSCYYWTQFCGDYLFHTRKYHPYTHKMLDGRIGKRVSMGCVRLYDSAALWIWRHAPSGTTVVSTY